MMKPHNQLAAGVAGLFPPNVMTELLEIDAVTEVLYPEENRLVEHNHARRIRDFTAGRIAARHVLAALGVSQYPLLKDGDTTLWPEGIIGSIAHSGQYAGVAVARKPEIIALGLDIEEIARTSRVAAHITTPHERQLINQLAPPLRPEVISLVFSAKESLFKAIHPLVKTYFGFQNAEVEWDLPNQTYQVTLLKTLSPIFPVQHTLTGRFYMGNGYIFTGMSVSA